MTERDPARAMRRRGARTRLVLAWDRMRERLWLWPTLAGLAAAAAAELLVRLDRSLDDSEIRPLWIFSGDDDAARSVLTTIATATMTVLGVTLSITLAVLALTIQGYSPRVIRRFTRDRIVQAVIAGFTASFVFALVALRLVRHDSVPGITVSVAVALAFLVVALLVAFFHHLASEIRVERVVHSVWRETAEIIPLLLEDGPEQESPPLPAAQPVDEARAPTAGRVRSVDLASLTAWADRNQSTLVIVPAPGEFVAEGQVVLRAFGPARAGDRPLQHLAGAIALGTDRTLRQDVGFGLRQLADIALHALSPSVNDPTTASEAIARLADLLRRLAGRRLGPQVMAAGQGAVIQSGPDWDALIGIGFDQVAARAESQADAATAVALLDALERVLESTTDPRRIEVVRGRARRVRDGARRALVASQDLDRVERAAGRLV